MLHIQSFVKRYSEDIILSVDSLSLSAGIHFVRGDNGSGKSTFFRCLAGITPCKGKITVSGVRLDQEPVKYRRLVNFAEAEPLYPPFLTARDLMVFVGRSKNAAPEQLEYYKERLGVGWFYTKPCGTYSSGMLKKLSLALAFLGNPDMLVLDEPLITLDETTRTSLQALIEEKKETIVLLSSHQALGNGFPRIAGSFRIENKTLVPDADN